MEEEKPKKKTRIFIIILIVISIVGGFGSYYLTKDKKQVKKETKAKEHYTEYKMTGNDLQKFDLYFMQLENKEENKVYSPLSIKYALEMLAEGAKGETKTQLDDVIGSYTSRKYNNTQNMSFANALFVKNSKKSSLSEKYANTLKDKYNAEVIFDDFDSPANMNTWIKNRTFNLISDLLDDDVVKQDFVLANALAIDMEWIQTIQGDTKDPRSYNVYYPHEDFYQDIGIIGYNSDYGTLKFNDKTNAKTVEIAAAINKYDIVNKLGEDSIKKTLSDEYQKWYEDTGKECGASELLSQEDVDKYIEEVNANYRRLDYSTDFMFYDDDNVKTFAKNLKTYEGITLQYIGIMPKKDTLKNYIDKLDLDKLNDVLRNLKDVSLNNFKDGVVTEIKGQIPLFNFEYTLDLVNDLKNIKVTNIFDSKKADLTGISKENAFINSATHKAKIEFSNNGIKAAAATALNGGFGDISGCEFDYIYKVPVETIDLTFNKPYMFIIRDKSTGEVWFTGTVYTPETK